MLELYASKDAHTVLRGGGEGDLTSLPDPPEAQRMAIKGHKEVNLHRDEPAPSGFSVLVVWFAPKRAGGPRLSVTTVADLRRVLAPYAGHERLVVYLDRDGGESGS